MIALLMLIAAMAAWGQPTGDGAPLLSEVADAWRGVSTWRIEGVANLGPYNGGRRPFFASKGGPLRSRFVADPLYRICDGESLWRRDIAVYVGDIKMYDNHYAATVETCRPPFPRWEDLLSGLLSATLEGQEAGRGCMLVKATYDARVSALVSVIPPSGLVTREMCVDAARKVLVAERLEGGRYIRYDKTERDPQFGPDGFRFPDALPADISKGLRIRIEDLPVCAIGSRCMP